jgi:hypothetical protein
MQKFLSFASTLKTVALACVIFTSLSFSSALTISPARIELTADPGSTIANEFTIINEQDAEQTFYTSVENFEAQGESGTPNFTISKEGFAGWVQVAEKITLKKNEKAKIQFSVNVPQGADAGGHFAAIFLSTVPPAAKGGEVSVGAKVGMLMLLRVSGDIKEGGGALSFALKDGSHFVTTLPVNFVYRFNNTGNDRVNPVGNVSIKNMLGLETVRLNANPATGNVLPSSTRRFDVTWGTNPPLPESASFFSHVAYEFNNFAFGFYFANLSITFGSSGSSDRSTMLFVFPWHLLLVVFVVLVMIFLFLRAGVKRYNRFIIQQARLINAK